MLYTKSKDTEENIDIYFTRPLGLLWARFFNRFGVHPNTVTYLSILLGSASGLCFLSPSYRLAGWHGLLWNVLGILLLVWANIYDSTDGQLARMSGKTSRYGRILDGAAENVWFIFIGVSLVVRLWPDWGIWGFVAFSIGGFVCHANQSRMADYIRNSYLYMQNGQHQDRLSEQLAVWRSISFREHPLEKILQAFYLNYTARQERETPQMQRLMSYLREHYGDNIPEDIRRRYLEGTFPLLKWTNVLTFNWRAIVLYIAVLTDFIPLVLIFEIGVFTVIQYYMHIRHERLCRNLLSSISAAR